MSTPNPYEAPQATVTDVKTTDAGHPLVGMAITMGLLVLVVPAVFVGAMLGQIFARGEEQMMWGLAPALFFGAVQFLWVIPVALVLRKRGKTRTALGMWITAGVLFLLNGACFGLLFTTNFR